MVWWIFFGDWCCIGRNTVGVRIVIYKHLSLLVTECRVSIDSNSSNFLFLPRLANEWLDDEFDDGLEFTFSLFSLLVSISIEFDDLIVDEVVIIGLGVGFEFALLFVLFDGDDSTSSCIYWLLYH